MDMKDMEHLRAVATAVEPQFWSVEQDSDGALRIIEEGGSAVQTICNISPELDNAGTDVAEYIATLDPTKILDLISEVERLQKENEWLTHKIATVSDLARANHTWHRKKLKEVTAKLTKGESLESASEDTVGINAQAKA